MPASEEKESSKVEDLFLRAVEAYERKDYDLSVGLLTEALKIEPENNDCRKYVNHAVAAKWRLSPIFTFAKDNYHAAVARFDQAPKLILLKLFKWAWASLLWLLALDYLCACLLLQDIVVLGDPVGRKYGKCNWNDTLLILAFLLTQLFMLYFRESLWMLILPGFFLLLCWAAWVLGKDKKHFTVVWMLRILISMLALYEIVSVLRRMNILN